MKTVQSFGLTFLGLAAAAGLGYLVAGALAPPRPAHQPAGSVPVLEAAEDPAPGRQAVPGPLDTTPSAAPADPWVPMNNQGTRALEAGDYAAAEALFRECHQAEPENEVYRHNLAEALARIARREREEESLYEESLVHLEEAVELAPDRRDLAVLLGQWRKEADLEQGFWLDSSLHFDLRYDPARDDLLHGSQPLLDRLEAAYADFLELYGVDPVPLGANKLRVSLYRKETFDRLTGLGDWAGGVFDGSIRIPVEDLAAEDHQLSRVLRHELSHAFTRELGGKGVPGWLNEGLAQWLENDGGNRLERARLDLRGHELFPLERLEGSLASWSDRNAIRRAYAQSLALTEYIAREFGQQELFKMVAGCREGVSCAETFESSNLDSLDQVLADLAWDLGR